MTETDEIAAWLREQAEADLEAAGKATPGPWAAPVREVNGGVVFSLSYPEGANGYVGGVPVLSEDERRSWSDQEHIARHDPLTETARAESVLAVLDDYAATMAVKDSIEAKLAAGKNPGPNAGYLEALRELVVYDSVVRLLAAGYRYREGFNPGWL